jgi:hypothetical protein
MTGIAGAGMILSAQGKIDLQRAILAHHQRNAMTVGDFSKPRRDDSPNLLFSPHACA